ncbi:MAG: MarR family winged helix-turn-helix transcriptional regulator [Streptosporangiaceae bacterium]
MPGPGAAPSKDSAAPRKDLAAMVVPLARVLMAAERPVLDAHDLPMWGYVVLLALTGRPVRTQAALAQAIGADKTRIIGVLDELQDRGLIERRPDPEDRRAHLLSVTPRGVRLREAVQAEIQRQEEALLERLAPGDRAAFLRALATLAEVGHDEFPGPGGRSAEPGGGSGGPSGGSGGPDGV